MEFGYNPVLNKRRLFLPIVFWCVRTLSKIWSLKRHYKINAIKLINDEYHIAFYYPGSRIILIKTACEIFRETAVISKFNYEEAALIGFCVSNPTQQQLDLIKTIKNKSRPK